MTTVAAVKTNRWDEVRELLRETVDRFGELLHTVGDPDAPAVGGWDVADTAAHVVVVCSLNVHTASGGAVPFVAPAALPLVPTATVDSIARINALAAEVVTERSLPLLAEEIACRVEALLRVTSDADPEALWPWLGGAKVSTAFLLCHTLNELLVHGQDIASAERRPWPIAPATAALVFEVFVLGLLRGDSGGLLAVPSPPTGRVRARVGGPLGPSVTVVAEHGRLFVDQAGGPVDFHLWAEPAALMLVLWRRSGVLRPLLTGRLRLWGWRPWRATRFLACARNP